MSKAYYAFPFSIILPADEIVHRHGEANMSPSQNGEVIIAYTDHCAHKENGLIPIEGDNDTANICAIRFTMTGQVLGIKWELVSIPITNT